ncbi:SsgA family sporulation/cell division regulator [Amycolatopsis sp. YIM 10]|uniref:SsgA family sporulation/cell division regulator n=1 Tax=Amycolatopsis sp. YIM 10 TaxID=2653857 RepID=UPI0012904E3B|nr:SsgA family sporulation/cell division regulator [Amycolatopsis sp. YIM 10]QFU90956.1 Sporulation and cell division protein [Amycolatopsis sp. YIM 10]
MRIKIPALLPCGAAEVSVRYSPCEPFAITLRFPRKAGGQNWVLSRELLADGLRTGTAGVGDVRVNARGELAWLDLSTPDGEGWAVFRRADLTSVVELSHVVVRPGTESRFLNWADTAEFPGVAL